MSPGGEKRTAASFLPQTLFANVQIAGVKNNVIASATGFIPDFLYSGRFYSV
jgi:hypothetical protein